MSARDRKAAKDRARGKAWETAKAAVLKLDSDQQRILLRFMVAQRWQRLVPKNQMQEDLKEQLADKMTRLLDGLTRDLVELETLVKVNRIKSFLPHLRAAGKAYAARGGWSIKAVKILYRMPQYIEFAEEGHKLWTGFDARKHGWKLGGEPLPGEVE